MVTIDIMIMNKGRGRILRFITTLYIMLITGLSFPIDSLYAQDSTDIQVNPTKDTIYARSLLTSGIELIGKGKYYEAKDNFDKARELTIKAIGVNQTLTCPLSFGPVLWRWAI